MLFFKAAARKVKTTSVVPLWLILYFCCTSLPWKLLGPRGPGHPFATTPISMLNVAVTSAEQDLCSSCRFCAIYQTEPSTSAAPAALKQALPPSMSPRDLQAASAPGQGGGAERLLPLCASIERPRAEKAVSAPASQSAQRPFLFLFTAVSAGKQWRLARIRLLLCFVSYILYICFLKKPFQINFTEV